MQSWFACVSVYVHLIERQIQRVRWRVKQSFISRPLTAVTARTAF